MGMTMAEKALARAAGRETVRPDEYVTAHVDKAMGHEHFIFPAYRSMVESGFDRVWDPDRIVWVIDHGIPAPTVGMASVTRTTFPRGLARSASRSEASWTWCPSTITPHQLVGSSSARERLR